jgi:ACS family glucarate transporter-like MFS transporter
MSAKFPYRYRILIFLFFLILITYLDRICISLLGVRIKSELHLSNEQFGWVLGSFALAYALFEIPSGVLGDRIGQRKVFMRIVLWWSLFTALTGVTTGFLSLMAVRFLFGMGEAGAFPNSAATISRWFPATETARSASWLIIGLNAGAAIAPLIVIPIASVYGWRAPFFVNGVIGVVWVLICFLWFRNHPSEMKAITNEERDFIEKNRRFNHNQRFSWKAAFKNRSLWALVLSFHTSQWAGYFFIAWMPVYLQEGRHFSENEMKLITSSLFIVGIISAFSTGFLSDWFVKRNGLRFARRFMGMLCLGMLGGMIFITAMTTSKTIVVVSLITAYFFLPANTIASLSACIDIGGNNAGTVVGIKNFIGQIGSFLLAIVFGKIVDITHDFNAPLFVLAGVLFAGCLLWLAVDAGKPLRVETKDNS